MNFNKSQTTGYIVHLQNVSLQVLSYARPLQSVRVSFGPALGGLFQPRTKQLSTVLNGRLVMIFFQMQFKIC